MDPRLCQWRKEAGDDAPVASHSMDEGEKAGVWKRKEKMQEGWRSHPGNTT
jgi:hypothetical protein